MSSVNAHRDAFIKLIDTGDEDRCIEYINKYNDFYDAIYTKPSCLGATNMLILACDNRLREVAIALIDKKCDLTYQNEYGYTALISAFVNNIYCVVAHIVDNLSDTATRFYKHGQQFSEMMYLCCGSDNQKSVAKMIDKGYDIYYRSPYDHESLIKLAVQFSNKYVVKKLIDKDTDFAAQFTTHCIGTTVKKDFYDTIVEYIHDRHDIYKNTIIAVMDDASPANALYNSFHTTYAVQLVNIICDFILLPIKKS
ncbi:MAG: hypothetical protein Faunusvirus13_26 [Faunusvirus sp.]|uniref:Uncharacterized protein n=1 Tax=Faunusvirus sp. TaxID=2487766 RepID=A0A3G5A0R7_9VIRU|nr:MAG: hypothetical protein Faunusvirus13_26 [Faunusvirus sp.]